VADTRHVAATVEDERQVAGAVVDFDFNRRNSGAGLHAHSSDFSARLDSLSHRQVLD
jgi:hypothetical protein